MGIIKRFAVGFFLCGNHHRQGSRGVGELGWESAERFEIRVTWTVQIDQEEGWTTGDNSHRLTIIVLSS